MGFKFREDSLLYGEREFTAMLEEHSAKGYLPGRLPNRVLLDFGLLTKDERAGMSLLSNQIYSPCLLKSLHAPSPNNTTDTIVMEIHSKLDQGVRSRFFLQYYSQNEMPISYPELILFPENVIYVLPGQDSRVMIVLEPVNLMSHATTHVGEYNRSAELDQTDASMR